MKKIIYIALFCFLIYCGGFIFHNQTALTLSLSLRHSDEVIKEWSASPDTTNAKPVEQQDLIILMYHQIRDKVTVPDTQVTPDEFEDHIKMLSKFGYHAITIQWLYDFLYNHKQLPSKPVLITFDDGYYSNYKYGLPVLEKYHFRATIFPIGNRCEMGSQADCGRFWLSDRQLKIISRSGYFDVQSHTFAMHDHVKTADGKEEAMLVHRKAGENENDFLHRIRSDLKKSEDYLHKVTGQHIISLAYPFGEFSDDTVKAVKQTNFKMAFTTEPGVVKYNSDPFRLPRITVEGGMSGAALLDRIHKYTHP